MIYVSLWQLIFSMKQLVSIYKQDKETQNIERLWKFCCGRWQMMSQAAAARLQTIIGNAMFAASEYCYLSIHYPSNQPLEKIQASFPLILGQLIKSLIFIYFTHPLLSVHFSAPPHVVRCTASWYTGFTVWRKIVDIFMLCAVLSWQLCGIWNEMGDLERFQWCCLLYAAAT